MYGTYDVEIFVERVQYVDSEKIETVAEALVLSPEIQVQTLQRIQITKSLVYKATESTQPKIG